MSRAPKQPIIYEKKLKIPKEFLRFATPSDAAKYRAKRLKCDKLLELGAGVGGQTIAFSKTCRKVIAVEIDKERVRILKENLERLNIKNVEVINGDALNKGIVQKMLKESPDIVFFDTERPEQAERTLDNINPNPREILEVYSKITTKIAIEIPPFTTDLDSLKENFSFEQEFLSLTGQLNRLTLYFNELKISDKSVIALPSEERLENKRQNLPQIKNSLRNVKYIYSIDPAVISAKLTEELAIKFNCDMVLLNKPILISNKEIRSHFLTGYKILVICENRREKILEYLKKVKAGKVTLRYSLEPKEYWKVRNFYESELTGKKEVNLFIHEQKNEAIICEKF